MIAPKDPAGHTLVVHTWGQRGNLLLPNHFPQFSTASCTARRNTTALPASIGRQRVHPTRII